MRWRPSIATCTVFMLLQACSGCRAHNKEGPSMQPTSGDLDRSAAHGSRVEYAIEGGPEMGSGIHEVETRLRIRVDAGDAFLELHQPSSAEGGEPLGTFKTILPAELVSHLRAALEDATLWSLPPSTVGGPGSSLIRVSMSSDGVERELRVSSRDIDAVGRIDPIVAILNDAVTATMAHPFQAVRFIVHSQAPIGGQAPTFAISVKNVGTETVALPDLRVFGGDPEEHPDRDLSLRVAVYPEERPGYTAPPLVWERLAFAVATGTPPPLILLGPGQEAMRERIVWTPLRRGGRHLVQAGFAFYGGPPAVEGHLVIRGRALSEAVEVTSAK